MEGRKQERKDVERTQGHKKERTDRKKGQMVGGKELDVGYPGRKQRKKRERE